MNSRRLTTAVLGIAVLASSLVTMTSADASADLTTEQTRIMIVGDSVTRGRDEDYTWRYFAYKGLVHTGADVDFVGPNGVAPHAAMDFDQDHASWWGFTVWQIIDKGWFPDAPQIDELVTAHNPDVIVEQLGVNDLTWIGMHPDGLASQIETFIAKARASKPDVDIVLGSLPQTWVTNVNAYNALLPGLAADLTTPDSRIVVTPVAPWVNGVDTYDNVHPSTAGDIKLAKAVSIGLEQLGVGSAIEMAVPVVESPVTPPVVIESTPVVAPEPILTPPVTLPEPVAADPEPVEPAAAAPALAAPVLTVKALWKGRIRVTWPTHAGATRLWIRDVTAGRRWAPLAELSEAVTRYTVRMPRGHRIKVRAAAVIAGVTSPTDTAAVRSR